MRKLPQMNALVLVAFHDENSMYRFRDSAFSQNVGWTGEVVCRPGANTLRAVGHFTAGGLNHYADAVQDTKGVKFNGVSFEK